METTETRKIEVRDHLDGLIGMRLHELKTPLTVAAGYAALLHPSKASRKLDSNYRQAAKVISSYLPKNIFIGKESDRKYFVDFFKGIMESSEGPLYVLSKSHHSSERAVLDLIRKNHEKVIEGLSRIYADYSVDKAYNVIKSVCDQVEDSMFEMKKMVMISSSIDEQLRSRDVNVDDVAVICSIPLKNSADAIGPEGTINFSSHIQGDNLEIRVLDNGKGIPPHILSALRDPAEVGVTYGKENGSGVGIPILRRTLHKYNGRFEIESEEGRTEVTMHIPLDHLVYANTDGILIK